MVMHPSALDRWSALILMIWCLVHSQQTSGQIIKWSECSRTCGGGVRRALNGCVQYGPDSECLSYNKSYVSCNTQPCPPGTKDFRTSQCEQYEKKPIFGKLYKLEAYISATSGAKCELYCRTKGDKFYLKFSDTVVDGTPCGPDLSGICVENVCKDVGCDRQLGSKKKFDACMVCDGDGSSCKKQSKTFNLSEFKGAGYYKLLNLPKGASSINVRNPGGVNKTFIAITSSDGEFLLNGQHKIANSRSLEVGGVYFNYSRSPEALTSLGPITEELVVMVLVTRPTDAVVHVDFYLPVPQRDSMSASLDHNVGIVDNNSFGVDEDYDDDVNEFLRVTDDGKVKVKSDQERSEFVTFAEDLPMFRTNQFFAAQGNAGWKMASGKSSGALETKVESGDLKGDDDDEQESSSGESPEEEVVVTTEKSKILDMDKEKEESGKEEDDDDDDDHESSATTAEPEVTTVESKVTTVEVTTVEETTVETTVATSPLGEESGIPTGVDEEDEDDDDDETEASGSEPPVVTKDDADDDDDDVTTSHVEVVGGDDADDDDDDDDKKASGDEDETTEKKASGDHDGDEEDEDEVTTEKPEVSGVDDDDDAEEVDVTTANKVDDDDEDVSGVDGDDDKDDHTDVDKDVKDDDDKEKDKDGDDDDDDDDEVGKSGDDDDDKDKKGSGDEVTTEVSTTETDKDVDEDDDDDKDKDKNIDGEEIVKVDAKPTETKKDDDDDDDEETTVVTHKDDDEDDDDEKVSGDEDDDKVTKKVDDDEEDDKVTKKVKDDEDDDDDDDGSSLEASGDHLVVTSPVVTTEGKVEDEKVVTTVTTDGGVKVEEDDDDDDDDDVTTAKKADEDDGDEVKRGSGTEVKTDDDDDDDDDGDDDDDVVTSVPEVTKDHKDDDDDDDDVVTQSGDKDDDDEDDEDDDDDDDDEDETGAGDHELTTKADEVTDVQVASTPKETVVTDSDDDDDDETTKRGSGDDEDDDDDDDDDVVSVKPVDETVDKGTTSKLVESPKPDDDDTTTKGSGDGEDDDDDDDDDYDYGDEVTTKGVELSTKGFTEKEDEVTKAKPTTASKDDLETTDLDELTTSPQVSAGDDDDDDDDDEKPPVTTLKHGYDEEDDDEDATTGPASGSGAEGSGGEDTEVSSGYEVTQKVREVEKVKEVTETAKVTEVTEVTDIFIVDKVPEVTPTIQEVVTDEEDKVTFVDAVTDQVVPDKVTEFKHSDTTTVVTEVDTDAHPVTVEPTPSPTPVVVLTPHPIAPPTEEEEDVKVVTEGDEEVTEVPKVVEPEVEVTTTARHPEDYDVVEEEKVEDVDAAPCGRDEFSKYHEKIVKEKFTRWYVGLWGACDTGKQLREVICVVYDDDDNMTITVNEERCTHPKPKSARRCILESQEPLVFIENNYVKSCRGDHHCKQYEWISSDWMGCSSSCEEEYDTRLVFCSEKRSNGEGHIVSEDHCKGLDVPDARRECHRQEIACELKPKWFATEWGECSTKCGVGTQSRRVFCGKIMRQTVGDTILLTQEENCDHHTKLAHIKYCRRDCDVKWAYGPYGECSASCGGGVRTRQVVCLKGHVLSDECDAYHKPLPSLECNYHLCPVAIPELPCESSLYGCCPDGVTPADGYGQNRCRQADHHPLGACASTAYGCCPDGVTAARGSDGQGCDEVRRVSFGGLESCVESEEGSGDVKCMTLPGVSVSCHETEFHCCPDGLTAATGPHYQGCPGLDCRHHEFGCCADGVTSALGAHGYGCPEYIAPRPPSQTRPCVEHFYGCCLDGVTLAQGPEFEDCPLEMEAPKVQCSDTEYGCCLDQKTPASGPHHAGCPIEHRKKGICFLPSESGTCHNHTIMWYYDSLIGECSRFWYSGCGTNGNLFGSEEDCKAVCISPPDHDKCFLPKVVGRCRASIPKFFYNVETQSCESFSYGGCGENANNFDSQQTCDLQCTIPLTYNVCQLPPSKGPCAGHYAKWYYDSQSKRCQQFYYGGCLGNENRFDSYQDCEKRCVGPITDVCSLEPDSGPCNSVIPFWHFNSTTDTCERFYYGGCHGNLNRFTTKQKCLNTCLLPKKESQGICNLPHEFGLCSGYYDKWYYDQADGYCKKFVYSGCGGTLNRFDSEVECRSSCDAKEPISDDVCSLPWNTGPCTDYTIMYYFNKAHQACDRFYYGGCEGNANRYHTEEECLSQCGESRRYVEPVDRYVVDTPTEKHEVDRTEHVAVTTSYTDSEVCSLAYDVGTCSNYTILFYFDQQSQSCNRFYYGGCGGNPNRYETEEECSRKCRKEEEPGDEETRETTKLTVEEICAQPYETGTCANYTILFYYSPQYKSCLRFYYGGCKGNLNRFGSEEDCTQFCAPKSTDVTTPKRCSLLPEHGPCRKPLARWHYDHVDKKCRMFSYGGCDGNKNRFMTEQTCLNSCHPDYFDRRSVDYSAESKDTDEGLDGEVVPDGEDTRQSGVVHQVTDEELSATSRPAHSNLCHLPSEAGSCSNWEVKWYYDTSYESCMQFWYGGCEGNDNRFATTEECEARCKPATQPPPEPYPAPHQGRHEETRRSGGHEDGYSSETVCSLTSSSGPCNNYEIKWYFDPVKQTCLEFYYGGCEGNANRFETKDQCQRYCQHGQIQDEKTKVPVADYCSQSQEPGQCGGHELRFYWDHEHEQCRPFYYTGCQGNQNNFESASLCYQHCGANVKEENRLEYTRESCSQHRESGTCYEFVIRYYYDKERNDCLGFYFGGCGGNSNNFHSYEDCSAICLPKPTCPACDLNCPSGVKYETDSNGCQKCLCLDHHQDHHHQSQVHHGETRQQVHQQQQHHVTIDTGKQLVQAYEYAVFTCNGHIEPGFSVMVERDGSYVAGVIAPEHKQAQISFNATESGLYKCVVQMPNGHSFESLGSYVIVYNVFLNASMDNEHLILTCDGFGLDHYADEIFATFKKVDENNRLVEEHRTDRPSLSHTLHLSLEQETDHSGKYICELHSRLFNFSSNYALVTIRLHDSPDRDNYYNGEHSGGYTQPVHDHAIPNEFDDSGLYYSHQKQHGVKETQIKLTVEGRNSEVLFKCTIQGLPQSEEVRVRWERNGKEIYTLPERIPHDGTFQIGISNSDLDESGTYSCIIEHGGRTFASENLNLQRVAPGQITLHAYKQLIDDGEVLRVDCTAGVTAGTRMTLEGSGHVLHPVSTSFVLGGVRAEFQLTPQSSRDFKCRAHLNRGLTLDSPVARITLKSDPSIQAKLTSDKSSYSEGDEILLKCEVGGAQTHLRDHSITFKHYVPNTEQVLKQYNDYGNHNNVLRLNRADDKHTGYYKCEVVYPEFGHRITSNSVHVNVTRPVVQERECVDMPAYADCNLVVKARFCSHHYFQKFCCRSCRSAGLI